MSNWWGWPIGQVQNEYQHNWHSDEMPAGLNAVTNDDGWSETKRGVKAKACQGKSNTVCCQNMFCKLKQNDDNEFEQQQLDSETRKQNVSKRVSKSEIRKQNVSKSMPAETVLKSENRKKMFRKVCRLKPFQKTKIESKMFQKVYRKLKPFQKAKIERKTSRRK